MALGFEFAVEDGLALFGLLPQIPGVPLDGKVHFLNHSNYLFLCLFEDRVRVLMKKLITASNLQHRPCVVLAEPAGPRRAAPACRQQTKSRGCLSEAHKNLGSSRNLSWNLKAH